MAERLTLTTPEQTTEWKPCCANIRIDFPGHEDGITMHFVSDRGEVRSHWAAGRDLVVAFSKADLRTQTLPRRMIQYALAQGWFGPGSVTGTVE